MVGVKRGRVIRKKFLDPIGPVYLSRLISSLEICFKADRKISMEEPNCHTASRISTQIAVLVSPSQAKVVSMPTIPSSRFITPSVANILFHRMATATDPPIMDGR